MNIREMHKLFRVLGQQMGMNEFRAILPSSIDNYLNVAIIDTVKNFLKQNVTTGLETGFSVVDRGSISSLNALMPLYCESTTPENVLAYLGINVQYNRTGKIYNCRIIDALELENTLNDFCNSPSKEYPIATIVNDIINIYTGDYIPDKITTVTKFIKYPDKVYYDENHDEGTEENTDVSCNLPEYLHSDIVKYAVANYFQSVGYTTPSKNNDKKE